MSAPVPDPVPLSGKRLLVWAERVAVAGSVEAARVRDEFGGRKRHELAAAGERERVSACAEDVTKAVNQLLLVGGSARAVRRAVAEGARRASRVYAYVGARRTS